MAAAALLFIVLPVAEAQFSDELISEIEHRMNVDQIPSVSMAFFDADGEVHYKSLGYMSLDRSEAVDEHTLYEIGSVTKTFTASILMMLLDERGLDADVTINELIGSDHELQLPEPYGDAITLSHMMSHFSGIPRLPGNMIPADDSDPYKDYTIEAMIEYVSSMSYNRPPGEEFEYSNLVYMLLGYLVSEIEGKAFDDVLSERLTLPLEMNSTFREVPETNEHRVAQGSAFGEPAASWHFDEMRGLGELRSSTYDMARYLKAQAGQLPLEGIESVRKTHVPVQELSSGRQMTQGWFVYEMEDGDTIIGHGGGTGGYRAFAAFSKETGRGAVVLTNSITDVADITLHLVNNGSPLRDLPELVYIDEHSAASITGMYLNDDIGMMTITYSEGVLRGQIQGQPALPLEHVEHLTYRNRMVGAEITFNMSDDESRASGFVLRQGGMEFQFAYTTEAPEGPQRVEMSREELEEYAGNYDSNMGLSYEIRAADGYLSARLSGQPFASVYPEGNDRFFYDVVVAAMQFSRDDYGNINGVVLQQGGQEIRFNKRDETN